MESIKKHSEGINISLYVAALALFVAVLSALFFYREFNKLRETSKNLQLREQVIGLGKRIDSTNMSQKAFEQHVKKQFMIMQQQHQSLTASPAAAPYVESQPQEIKFVPRTVEDGPLPEEEEVEEEENSDNDKAKKEESEEEVVVEEKPKVVVQKRSTAIKKSRKPIFQKSINQKRIIVEDDDDDDS